MSSYACEPDKGSEPEAGWQWAVRMSEDYCVTVITRSNNRGGIEDGLAKIATPRPQFIYYDLPWLLKFLKAKGLPVSMYYILWQIGVRLVLRKHLQEFDLIHHVTFNSFRQPGFWWFCRIPVIIGPLGGGQIAPWGLFKLFNHRFKELVRSISVMLTSLSPLFLLSWWNASTVVFSNYDTARRIPYRFRKRMHFMVDVGVNVSDFHRSSKGHRSKEMRLIWVGRLDEYKAPRLALEAFAVAYSSNPDLRLTFVGSGPEHSLIKNNVKRLGLENVVTLSGRVPKNKMPDMVSTHDVFLFTSLRDTSGNVILEAMASGLPSICLNHHGASEMHTCETALLVKLGSIEETKHALAEAIVKLSASPELVKSMGAKAREKVGQYDWSIRAKVMDGIYREALRDSAPSRRR